MAVQRGFVLLQEAPSFRCLFLWYLQSERRFRGFTLSSQGLISFFVT
jgi:hypothetical protein